MKRLFTLIVLLILAASVKMADAQSFQVIVNPDNAISSISKQDLSDIFLKRQTRWDNGNEIVPVDQSARSTTREAFSQDVHGRSVGAIRSHWQQAAFSGAGTAPLERSSDADMIEYIRSNSGAIGYISVSADPSGVKVITVQ